MSTMMLASIVERIEGSTEGQGCKTVSTEGQGCKKSEMKKVAISSMESPFFCCFGCEPFHAMQLVTPSVVAIADRIEMAV